MTTETRPGVDGAPYNTTNTRRPRPDAKPYLWRLLAASWMPFGWVLVPLIWGRPLAKEARARGYSTPLGGWYMAPLWLSIAVYALSLASLAALPTLGRYIDSQARQPYIEGTAATQPATGSGGGAVPAQPAGTECLYYGYGGGQVKQSDLPPMSNVPNTGTVTATITTNFGNIVMELDRAKAPCAINSFRYLAKRGYFSNTPCHRFVDITGFHILQCGDPFGTGMGGPGYRFDPENLPTTTGYSTGDVILANSTEGGGKRYNGSQFIILYGETPLPPEYTVIGRVTQGLELVQQAAVSGATTDPSGTFKLPVTIKQVSVS